MAYVVPTQSAAPAHTHAESEVTNLTTDLAAKALKTTTVSAGTGLTGGGDLSANRTLTVSYGTTAGTACQGNDARLSDARTPLAHAHAPSDVTGTAVVTADPRLSDARTPTDHAPSHSATGTDPLLETVYECDFTALATSAAFADGNVVIDGITYVAANVANASTFKVVNGSGIQTTLNANASALIGNSQRSSPMLTVPLPSFNVGLVNPNVQEIRAWLRFGLDGMNQAGELCTFGYETNPYSDADFLRVLARRGSTGAADYWYSSACRSAAAESGPVVLAASPAADDVMMLRWLGPTHVELYTGAYGATWPTLASLHLLGVYYQYNAWAVGAQSSPSMDTSPLCERNIGLIFATHQNGLTHGNLTSLYKALKVEARWA